MGSFIAGRLPSRAVLDEFRPYLADVDRGTTLAARAFMDLDGVLAAHDAAVDRLDRAERRFIAAKTAVEPFGAEVCHGQADGGGAAPSRPQALPRPTTREPGRSRPNGTGSRRRALAVRKVHERRLRARVRQTTDHLHAVPPATWGDVALKLAVTIAVGEAGPPDAAAFPWLRLRQVLADMVRLTNAGA